MILEDVSIQCAGCSIGVYLDSVPHASLSNLSPASVTWVSAIAAHKHNENTMGSSIVCIFSDAVEVFRL